MMCARIPTGFRAVPLHASSGPFGLPVCVLIRQGNDSADWELASGLNLPGWRSFLGCVLDGSELVRAWVEIWVQNSVSGDGATAQFERLTNPQLDALWSDWWAAIEKLNPSAKLAHWKENTRQLSLDRTRGVIVTSKSASGEDWVLCRDDARLARAGLSEYSRTTKRYLASVENGQQVYREAEAESLGPNQPLNPDGGEVVVRTHPLLTLPEYLRLLNGESIFDVLPSQSDVSALIAATTIGKENWNGSHQAFLLSGGPAELFYLKLKLFSQAVHNVWTHLRQAQCLLLNLTPLSFAVDIAEVADLPWPWLARCELVRPGRAIKFEVPGVPQPKFLAAGSQPDALFCPGGMEPRDGQTCSVRITRMLPAGEFGVSLEGSVQFAGRQLIQQADLVRLRLPFGEDFWGTVTASPGNQTELEFKTWPRSLSDTESETVRSTPGGRFLRCWAQVIPSIGAPYDMYSLAMIGVAIFLENPNNEPAAAAGQLHDLGRAVGNTIAPNASFEEISGTLLAELETVKYPRLAISNCAGRHPISRGAPFIPSAWWAELLTVLVRLTPELGNASLARDFSPLNTPGVDAPLVEPLKQLENLTARTRSCLFANWHTNEVARVALTRARAID